MTKALFRQQAIEHQKDRLHGEVLIQPKLSHVLLTIFIVIWVVLTIIWLTTSTYTRKETVNGWLEPPAGLVRVFPEDTPGKIEKIFVEEGSEVVEGQTLVVIKNERLLANGRYLEGTLLKEYRLQEEMLQQQLSRTESMFKLKVHDINLEIESAKNDLSRLSDQINTTKKRYDLAKKRADNYNKIRKDGYISEDQANTILGQELLLIGEIQQLDRSIIDRKNHVQKLNTQLVLMPDEHKDTKDQINSNLSSISQKITELSGQRAYTIKAARSGVISNLQAKADQKININIPLMTIVPEGSILEAKLLVPVRAAGFIQPKQNLDIRYDAFPYQKFGLYKGEITIISNSVLLPNELHNVPISIQEPTYLVRAIHHPKESRQLFNISYSTLKIPLIKLS